MLTNAKHVQRMQIQELTKYVFSAFMLADQEETKKLTIAFVSVLKTYFVQGDFWNNVLM